MRNVRTQTVKMCHHSTHVDTQICTNHKEHKYHKKFVFTQTVLSARHRSLLEWFVCVQLSKKSCLHMSHTKVQLISVAIQSNKLYI
jgi:hypothetical protein